MAGVLFGRESHPDPATKAPSVSETQESVDLDEAEGEADRELAVGSAIKEEGSVLLKEWDLRLEGEICFVRRGKDGAVERIATCRARSVKVGDLSVRFAKSTDFVELTFEDGRASVASGNPEDIHRMSLEGRVLSS